MQNFRKLITIVFGAIPATVLAPMAMFLGLGTLSSSHDMSIVAVIGFGGLVVLPPMGAVGLWKCCSDYYISFENLFSLFCGLIAYTGYILIPLVEHVGVNLGSKGFQLSDFGVLIISPIFLIGCWYFYIIARGLFSEVASER